MTERYVDLYNSQIDNLYDPTVPSEESASVLINKYLKLGKHIDFFVLVMQTCVMQLSVQSPFISFERFENIIQSQTHQRGSSLIEKLLSLSRLQLFVFIASFRLHVKMCRQNSLAKSKILSSVPLGSVSNVQNEFDRILLSHGGDMMKKVRLFSFTSTSNLLIF